MDNKLIYYVYIYKDPETNLPFYVGKGKKNRYRNHLFETVEKSENKHKTRKIKKIQDAGLTPVIDFYIKGVDEKTAFQIEELLIKQYGRIGLDDNGILTNKCISGIPPSNKGRKCSDETKLKLSLKAKERSKDTAYIKKLSDGAKKMWEREDRQKRGREANSNRWKDPEFRTRTLEKRKNRKGNLK